ncbi:tubulin-specific chaperone C-like isoform X2 [Varroa jacobsoni]|uniref:tubulin-specific chaperone C-like isoform X2 n=1 Tax=Varroa jacobsoni TaxID=62625 RepID=UPI000BF2E41B|nr:tubulin-specific chaperone C-like isoform X2 [Varroa jacobsoni]
MGYPPKITREIAAAFLLNLIVFVTISKHHPVERLRLRQFVIGKRTYSYVEMVSASESYRVFTLFAEQATKVDMALSEKNIDQSRILIRELQTLVNSQAAVLPSRDLQTYRERIENYKKKLDDIKAPKKRFAFSKAMKDAHSERLQGAEQKAKVAEAQLQQPGAASSAGDRVKSVANATFSLEGKRGENLELNNVHGEVELNDLEKCRVVIRGWPSTLYVNDVHDSTLICDPVANSVLIVGFHGSSLQVACQQLRVHKATEATFRLHITSRSIIEDCHNIKFGSLPSDYSASENSWSRSGLDRSTNNFFRVDDFNWLSTTQPSPNWKLLD